MTTHVFFREATVDSLHETLESLGAELRSQVVTGESNWALQTSDGVLLQLHVIDDFDRYSMEIWLGVLLKLAPAYEALGRKPLVTLVLEPQPKAEKAARQLVHDVLAIHPGVSHDADLSEPLEREKWEGAMQKMDVPELD